MKYFFPKTYLGGWSMEGVRKYARNTGWAFLGRIVTFAVSFFTIAIVVRYLGPEQYGQLSYAQNFVAIFSVFAVLGLDQILYRELVANPEKRNILLGTSIVMKLVFGSLSFLVAVGVAYLTQSDQSLVWLVAIVSLTFIFQPLGTIGHMFNAEVKTKYVTYVAFLVAFLLPAIRLFFVYREKTVYAFAALLVFETLIYGAGYLWIYTKVFRFDPREWKMSLKLMIVLLKQSWPLALASLSGYIYGRIDQVMMQGMISSEAVGWYDVAVRITELLTFLPSVIIASLFPALVNSLKVGEGEYQKRFKILSLTTILITALSSLVAYIAASWLIPFIFGDSFVPSIGVLQIYVWSAVGTTCILLIQNHLIANHKQRQFLYYSLMGALLNVGLNMVLIPEMGMIGAACATVLTLLVTAFVFIFFERKKIFISRRLNSRVKIQ